MTAPQTNAPTQEYIDDLDRQISEHEKETERLSEIRRAAIIEAWGIEIGMLVENTGRNDGWKIGRVCGIRNADHLPPKAGKEDGYSRPWLYVNPRKKDGSFSTMERHTFGNWKPVEVKP